LGIEGAVTVRGVGVTTIVLLIEAYCTGLLLSLTVAVKVEEPLTLAAPVIAPDGERLMPLGSVPEVKDQVYGAVPPLALKV
jgi:hypothetical protein